MDDISMENAILAQLRFGIDDIAKQMELIEQMAKQTALKAQEAFRNTSLLAPGNTQAMTAQQAMVNQITAQGETQRQAILNESNAKIAKMEAEAEYKRTATQAKASQARINQARVETAEIQTLTAVGKLEGIEQANKNMLDNNLANQKRADAKALANTELIEARKQAVLDESNAKQVLSREKADAAILQSAAKTQAQVENIQSRTGINTARAGIHNTKADVIALESAAKVDAINAKTLASVEKTEAQKAMIVGKGEAQISQIQAREALTRQQIARKEAATQIAITKQQVEQERLLYMQARRTAFDDKPQGFAGLMERRASWLVTGGLVMGGMAGIYETLSTIKDVEMGMTTIARVTEDAAFNFKGMRDELQQLGVTYGDTWDDVSDIAIRWAQAGYNMADTIELTKSSLLALNTAELNSEQATNGMIAIMAQWGLTAEELLPTIDKINKVADDFAITSTDLVAGLTRSSGAAKVLGLTMNETIAILTTMREATGRTGKEVGNALNSILSFMQRDKAIDTFEDLGIRVFADEAKTEFRNVIEIFDEMAAKWPEMGDKARDALTSEAEAAGLFSEEMSEVIGMQKEWNDLQQRDLSQAAAGVYRRNYLLALLQNWSMVDEVLISQENALGYSMKENERTMQTLEKQIEVLKASAEQLAVAVGDSGLLDELKGLVEGATGVIQAFNSLDDDFQMFIVTVAEVTLAVKLLDVALKSLGVQTLLSGGAKVAGLAAIGTSVSQAAKGLAGVTAAAAGAKAAVSTLGRGFMSAFGGPVGIAIAAAGTAIAFIARESNKASKELETQATMAEGLSSEYDNLESKLNGMTKGTDEYNKAAQELSVLKGNIAESLPGVVDGFDEETNSMIINRKAMGDLIQAGEELRKSKLENEDVINAEVKRLQEERKEHEANAQSYEMSQGVLDDLKKRREDLISVLDKQTNGSQESKDAQEALGETERLIADIAQEAGLKRNATVDEIMNKLRELSIAEKGKAIETQVSETEKTKSVISNSLKRLEVLNQEIAAHKSLLSGGQYYDDIPVWLKGKYNILPGGEFWTRKDLRADQVEAAKVNQELKSAQQTLAAQEKAIQNAQNEINKIQADSITGGPSGGPSGGPAGAGKKIDTIAEAMQRLADSSKQFELVNNGIDSVLGRVANTLNTASAEYDYLQGKVSDGTATSQDYARMQELITQKIIYLKREQAQLTTANEEYQKQIDALTPLLAKATAEYEHFRTAGDAEHMKDAASAVKDLQSGIDGLSSSIANNTAKIWENKTAIEGLSGTTYTAYYQQAMAWASHMERVGRLSKEQQIDYLRGIDQTRLALQDQWRLQEDMFSSLKDQMNDYMNQLDDERDSALKAIETRVSSTIAGLQAQIDALDQEEKTDNREEVARKHNEKIAQLQKDRQYHELRTGTEHAEAIAKIDEQIAEENRNWQQQQDDWVRDDKKEALRKQIEDTKEAGDEEKDAINENYKKAKRIIDQNMNTIINGLMAKKGEWQSAGKTLIDAFIEGIKSGDFSSVEALIDNLNTLVKKIKKKSKSDDDSPPPVPDDTVSKWFANEIAYLEGLKETGDAGQKEWANQALYLVNLARNGNAENKEWARQEAEKMGISIPQAHIGAYVEEGGLARLKHDERVLSPQLTASFDRLASILVKTPDITSRITGGGTADLNRVADRVIAAIERRKLLVDKAVNIEHVSFEDRADMQALGVEIRSMLTATG